MQWSDIQFNPSDKTLRQFAGLFLIIFGLLAVVEIELRHRSQLGLIYAALAVAIGPLGLLQPRLMRPIWVAWSVIAFPIGWVVSTIFLAVLFYGVFTPVGLAFRLTGRDVLALHRFETRSYWKPRPAPRSKREYFRQS
jgi:Saxitoxin biosynthesis operon protein SxtJ